MLEGVGADNVEKREGENEGVGERKGEDEGVEGRKGEDEGVEERKREDEGVEERKREDEGVGERKREDEGVGERKGEDGGVEERKGEDGGVGERVKEKEETEVLVDEEADEFVEVCPDDSKGEDIVGIKLAMSVLMFKSLLSISLPFPLPLPLFEPPHLLDPTRKMSRIGTATITISVQIFPCMSCRSCEVEEKLSCAQP